VIVEQEPTRSFRDTHADIQVIKCPNCGHELHFSKRTVSVTCRCGKAYMTQQSVQRSKSRV